MKRLFILITVSITFLAVHVEAQSPRVGRKAAAKYFNPETDASTDSQPLPERVAQIDRLMMLHVGGYSASTSYAWKDNSKRTGIAKATYGVTYLFETWNGVDLNVRFDFSEYKVDDDRATKLTLMPLWTFPLAETEFPIYFGLGFGVGVFFIQLPDESNLSFDYQLVAGTRFLNLIENVGAFVEFGLKNHLHLLSDGQVNATAIAAGAVFTL
jgi:hypothetical protein